jgi:hypothetical protein
MSVETINNIAEKLFTDGQGRKAKRLVMEFDEKFNETGWSKQAIKYLLNSSLTPDVKGEEIKPNLIYRRNDDMSSDNFLSLIMQEDGDVIVSIYTEGKGFNDVEFCTSGGRSHNTRLALMELMRAIKKDNEGRLIQSPPQKGQTK